MIDAGTQVKSRGGRRHAGQYITSPYFASRELLSEERMGSDAGQHHAVVFGDVLQAALAAMVVCHFFNSPVAFPASAAPAPEASHADTSGTAAIDQLELRSI